MFSGGILHILIDCLGILAVLYLVGVVFVYGLTKGTDYKQGLASKHDEADYLAMAFFFSWIGVSLTVRDERKYLGFRFWFPRTPSLST